MSRIDYSKWDKLDYSSSSEDDENEKRLKRQSARVDAFFVTEHLSLLKMSSSSPLWNGLVTHHMDIFVSHVLPKLNKTDRWFFSNVCKESRKVLAYAGVNKSTLIWRVSECTSISTLEWCWKDMPWGAKNSYGNVIDQTWFCSEVAHTNKLELLKWVREVKKCEWDEKTIKNAVRMGNLEMLKYCFANGCPCDEETEQQEATCLAARFGRVEILKYLVEERKALVCLKVQCGCGVNAATYGQLASLRYLVEEAGVPLNDWACIAYARIYKQHQCLNYLREKGCPEPTDEEYAQAVEFERGRLQSELRGPQHSE